MKVTIIGAGYVGLVTGTCLSDTGNQVLCIDINKEKVGKLKAGQLPIYEPNLNHIYLKNLKANRLHFSTSLKKGITHGDVIFLALPTPENEDGSADLKYVLEVIEKIAPLINSYKVIVNKSTVPVGTCEKISAILKSKTTEEFDVISNPEFLKEGVAILDFQNPDRIIIGATNDKSIQIMRKLYNPFIKFDNTFIVMSEKSAELTKYAANSFLATKISFINEIANFCERVDANVDEVRQGISLDTRIGKYFLNAGIGYGGSCFPKDIKALYKSGEDANYDFKILNAVMQVNKTQKLSLFKKVEEKIGILKEKKIAIWGISFKPETDDIREAPAIQYINRFLKSGAIVSVFDPVALNNIKSIFSKQISYGKDPYEPLENADALIICTEWALFKNPNFKLIQKLMKTCNVFDGRNIFNPQEMAKKGIFYQSVGR